MARKTENERQSFYVPKTRTVKKGARPRIPHHPGKGFFWTRVTGPNTCTRDGQEECGWATVSSGHHITCCRKANPTRSSANRCDEDEKSEGENGHQNSSQP